MDQKKRLFIYDRKEVGVLILLGVTVALFAFTLGIHLGKKVTPKDASVASTPIASPLPMEHDQIPDRTDMNEEAKSAPEAADDSLSRSLHEEVARTGIRMETPRAVDLPDETRSKTGGATSVQKAPAPQATEIRLPALKRRSSGGKYTLQVGAYRTLSEAKPEVDQLETRGVQPYVRQVNLNQKGQWYRVYVGGFDTVSEAEKAGARYKSRNIVSAYVVARTPD